MAGETTGFDYTSSGLMTAMTTPRGHQYTFAYGSLGRLTQDSDPAGGSKTLALTREGADKHSVSVTTGEGRTTTYGVERLGGDGIRQENTFPGGQTTVAETSGAGVSQASFGDGTTVSSALGPDPRWYMQAPIVARSARASLQAAG